MFIKFFSKLLIFSGAIFTGFLASYLLNKQFSNKQITSLSIPRIAESQEINASSGNFLPKVETISQPSPNGKNYLVMKTTNNADKSRTVEFTTTDESGENIKEIFYTITNEAEKFKIPFNTWSPDNKYVFILKNENQALLFKANGEQVLQDQQYLDIKIIFEEKIKDDIYKEVTGWASNTLLIVNSVKTDGSQSASYWFEVPSKAIIQLSSRY